MNDNQLQQLLQAINTLQDLGKVAYFNKGAYNSETTYEINDVVTYQGSSYVSLGNNNQGNLPTNATYWSVVALKGDKGETGKPFVIENTYISIQEMVADYDNMNVNDYVMISGSIEDEQNATLWTKTETPAPTYKWVYLADFSGASGITGQTPNIQIGNVTEGNEPAVTRRQGSTNENPILDFVLKTGAKGDTGATGNGISQVSKTSTSGLTDTYTIEYTSGNSTTFDVTNGKGITSIAKTSTSGLVDTYTITYNDETTSTFTITNGEDGEVTQAQLDETNNQVAKANMVYNALPKVSDEGDSLTLDGTANCPMKMELKGNTEQTTYTGKNLLDLSNLSTDTSNGITMTPVYENGELQYINLNGTSTNLVVFILKDTYNSTTNNVLNGCTGGSSSTYKLDYNVSGNVYPNYNNEDTTIADNSSGTIRIVVYSGKTLNNVKIYPMIRLSSVSDTTYEPYVGGTPSPNPDYPQDVRVVTGNNSVVVNDKQKIQLTNGTYSNASVTAVVNNGVITTSGTATGGASIIEIPLMNSIEIKANTTYEIALNNETTMSSAGCYLFVNSDTDKKTTFQNQNAEITLNETTDLTITKLSIRIAQGNEANLVLNPVLNYDAYQSQTYPINLGTMELCKIGSYQDYIYKDSGKWYKHSEIGKVVVNTSQITLHGNYTNIEYARISKPTNYKGYDNFTPYDILCSKAIFSKYPDSYDSNQNINKIYADAERVNYWLGFAKGTGLATIQEKLANTEIVYPLATPTNTEITDTTLISQLNAIENAVSYDTQTNIVQENYSEPFIINAECVRSLKDIFELIGNS